jgi:hypothetical protein
MSFSACYMPCPLHSPSFADLTKFYSMQLLIYSTYLITTNLKLASYAVHETE